MGCKNVKRLTKTLLCLLLVLGMMTGPASALAEATGTVNQTDTNEMSVEAVQDVQIKGSCLAGIMEREKSYNPASVLISGILYAPAGTEILEAVVECAGEVHRIPGSAVYRMKVKDFSPDRLSELQTEPDLDRAAFAFLVDLSKDNPAEGKSEAKVTLILKEDQEITLATAVSIEASMGRFLNVIPAVFDQAMYITYRGAELDNLQNRLVELNYLEPEAVTGECDQATMDAANRLLAENGYRGEVDNGYITAKAMGFIASDQVKAKGEGGNFLSFLKDSVTLFDREVPLWLLIAAGAALIVLLVLLALLIIGKKRKPDSQQDTDESDLAPKAFITSPEDIGAQILTIGDEPTMDLTGTGDPAGAIAFGEDEATTELKEPGYILRVRMFFRDVYLDKNLKLMENGRAVIGRGSEAAIQTNPEDASISHRHGVFTAVQGRINYQDESRNGTIYNGQRTIHKGETVTIPLNTKVQLEIGEHKILVIASRDT